MKYKDKNICVILKLLEEPSEELRSIVECEKIPVDFQALEVRRTERRKRQYYATLLLLAAEGFLGYRYNLKGAPELFSDTYFSISHSGNYLALAFSKHPVGIDIEDKNIRRNLALAKRFMNLREQKAMQFSEEPKAFFLRKWTEKEAAYKVLSAWFEGISFKELNNKQGKIFYKDFSLFPLRFSYGSIIGTVCIAPHRITCEC